MRRTLAAMGVLGLAAASAAGYDEADVQGGGMIAGTVVYGADAPAPEEKDVPADKQADCGAKAAVQGLVVDKETKGIQYAVVYIDKIAKGKKKPAEAIVLDQKTCVFMPHVVVAPIGTKLEFKNGDKAAHNVNVKAVKNKGFNRMIPPGGEPIAWTAEARERVPVACDVHPWMTSWVIVEDHPYVAVTDEKGNFKIEDVPAGEYVVKCWHEKLGLQQKDGVKVTVAAGQCAKAEFAPLKPK